MKTNNHKSIIQEGKEIEQELKAIHKKLRAETKELKKRYKAYMKRVDKYCDDNHQCEDLCDKASRSWDKCESALYYIPEVFEGWTRF